MSATVESRARGPYQRPRAFTSSTALAGWQVCALDGAVAAGVLNVEAIEHLHADALAQLATELVRFQLDRFDAVAAVERAEQVPDRRRWR